MSQSQSDQKDLSVITGLNDLELELLGFKHKVTSSQLDGMVSIIKNPNYLYLWVNAKPDILH